MKTFNTLLILMLITNSVFGQVTKVWETDTIFKYPESVAYDKLRDVLYVSNLTQFISDGQFYGDSYISKISKNGEIIKYDWIGNITAPTGITIANDKLYIVERFGIVEYDLKKDKISNKYLIQNTIFLNDITVGNDSSIYVSDSGNDIIYRIKNGVVEKWMKDERIRNTNGVLIDGNQLIVGVNSDNFLKAIDLKTKEIKKIAFLDSGVLDGIQKAGNDYLVSHYFGDLKLVKSNGEVTELLNTRSTKVFCADFEYIEKENLLIIPALRNKKIFAYKAKFK